MTINATRSLLALALGCGATLAASAGLDLGNYQLDRVYPLPAVAASEASGVTFNHDDGYLYVIGDEGDAIVKVTTAGVQVGVMTLTGFDDTEGITYIGGGKFAVTEERLQDLYELTFVDGGTVARSSLNSVSFGPTVGNIGLEGISYDAVNGVYIGVKEKLDQQVYTATIDFALGTAVVSDLFIPSLGLSDLSGVQVLSAVTSLSGDPDADNLLIYSQESSRLLEVTRTGVIKSSFDLTGVGDAEGVTVGPDGTIYIVGETPSLYVLRPVPEPVSAGLLTLSGLLTMRRRR